MHACRLLLVCGEHCKGTTWHCPQGHSCKASSATHSIHSLLTATASCESSILTSLHRIVLLCLTRLKWILSNQPPIAVTKGLLPEKRNHIETIPLPAPLPPPFLLSQPTPLSWPPFPSFPFLHPFLSHLSFGSAPTVAECVCS